MQSTNNQQDNQYISRKEVAEHLSASLSTLDRAIAAKRVVPIAIGRRVWFTWTIVDDWIERSLGKSWEEQERFE